MINSMNHRKISFLVMLLFAVVNASAQSISEWKMIHPGIWKAVIGKPDAMTLLSIADARPNLEAMAKLPRSNFPLPKGEISMKVVDHKTYLRFPLEKGEQLYGFGLNFKNVNQRGKIFNLHVDHYNGEDNGRTHAPVPFYVSSNGYGVLIDVARYITVYAGSGVRTDAKNPPELMDRNTNKKWSAHPYSDAVEILVPADGASIYVFEGPTPMQVVQRYNLMNGGGYLPPKWGLGFTQRVPTLYSQTDILKEVQEFKEHAFPLDFIGVEPGWQSMAYPCTFEWDKTRFPAPQAFIDSLSHQGIRANLWLNPYVSPVGSLYPKLKPLSGSHTVWNGIVPDITIPKTQQILKEHFIKQHLQLGVSGYKMDETDGYDSWLWPDVASFPSGFSAEQMRQIYGLKMQQMTAAWFRETNKRTYGLTRASNAGASGMPYVIYNDYYNHKDFITALVNSSFAGVLWTPEVRASKTAEEWVRRIQSVCFSPMAMLNAWADGTKPWSFPEVEKAVQEVAQLRMQLLPYIYNCFAQYHFEGKPPFRAMQLVEGFGFSSKTTDGKLDATANPYAVKKRSDIKDQYMMGDDILVAPMFAGEKTRTVYFPEGKWYDFYTGEYVAENQPLVITASLEKIPLFVRDGGIIPMVPPHFHAPAPGEKMALEIRHYGKMPANAELYDDDGISFDYEKGMHSKTKLVVAKNEKGELKGEMIRQTTDKVFSYKDEVVWKFMTSK
jgi:alpha-D-xyloside xylohydrolase